MFSIEKLITKKYINFFPFKITSKASVKSLLQELKHEINNKKKSYCVSESEEPDHDDQCVGGTGQYFFIFMYCTQNYNLR
jgi:hypothetical protein